MKGQIPMNEEEKEAIFEIKKLMIDIYNYMDIGKTRFYRTKYQIILELIDKQQKEIERLKKFEKYYENGKVVWQRKDYISIDKIKEIKEDYKNRRSNMTQIIFSKYGKTQKTLNQAVVNEVIKVLDEILGE